MTRAPVSGTLAAMMKLAGGLSLKSYHREWLAKDVVAGVVLTTLLVPQGMAYAELAGLPAAEPKPRWIVIAAEPVTDVDTTAADVLEELDEALNGQGIALVFAELKDPVRRKIERYGLTRTIEPRHFFPTVGAAVAAFCQETGAEWPAADPPHDIPVPSAG
jgi:MFS superfamily sulfate permease-like transporter